MKIVSIVRQVEAWYAARSTTIERSGIRLSIQSKDPADKTRGKVEVRVETPSALASVTFWNHGSVSVLTADKESRAEHVLDDRPIQSQDDVSSLLEKYLREIIEHKKDKPGTDGTFPTTTD